MKLGIIGKLSGNSAQLWIAGIAVFFSMGIQTGNYAYSYGVYLSSYPTTWVPYFMFVIVGSGLFVYTTILSYFKKKGFSTKNTNVVFIFLLVSSLFVLGFANIHLFFVPIISCLLLFGINYVVDNVVTGRLQSAFDIVTYKNYGFSFSMATAAGVVVFGLLNGFFMKHIGLGIVLYLDVPLLIVCGTALYFLPTLPNIQKYSASSSNPWKYSLFRQIGFILLVITIAYAIVEYVLNFNLKQNYNAKQIGAFISNLMAVGSLLGFMVSPLLLKLTKRINPAGAISCSSYYWVITGIIYYIFPSLASITSMAIGRRVLFYPIFSYGMNLSIVALPSASRASANFQMLSLITPLAFMIGTVLLILLLKLHIGLTTLVYLAVVANAILVFYSIKINKYYISAIKEELNLKRFDDIEELSNQGKNFVAKVAEDLLAGDSLEMVSFGLSILMRLKLDTLPKIVIQHIRAEDPQIRIQAITCILRYQCKDALSDLENQLVTEKDPEVTWRLLDAISQMRPDFLLVNVQQYLSSASPPVVAGVIRVLLNSASNLVLKIAYENLRKLLQRTDSLSREYAARVLRYAPLDMFAENLFNLINDENPKVIAEAVKSAIHLQMYDLLPIILDRAQNKIVFQKCWQDITQLNEFVLEPLVQKISYYKPIDVLKTKKMIDLIARLSTEKATAKLLVLASDSYPLLCNFAARGLVNRFGSLALTSEMKGKVLSLISTEIGVIFILRYLQKDRYQGSLHIITEIESRIFLAKQRLLYWLAIVNPANEVIALMPTVLYGMRIEKAKSVEVICLSLASKLVDKISTVFLTEEGFKKEQVDEANVAKILDPWLKEVISCQSPKVTKGGVMDNLQKAFVLRKTELFKNLPAEALLVIAESTQTASIQQGQVIFKENDPPTGLYVIVSGEVEFFKNKDKVNSFKENEFFGELALLDNVGRSTTAIAKSEGLLLFLERDTFERITDDIPEVLKAVVHVVMRYLRQYMQKAS